MRNYLFIAIQVLFFVTCTQPFDFEVQGTEELLVIDASFTNEVKAHMVRISFSFPLDERMERTVSGATVWIEDQDGVRIDFEETSRGIYETAPDVAGEIGNTYVLHVLTQDLEIQSTPETMQEPAEVDSIYGRYIGLPMDDGSFELGIQFFLDATGDLEKSRNYRFEFEETHQIRLLYGSRWSWDQDLGLATFRDTFLTDCYATSLSDELLIATSSGLAANSILEFPLQFVPERGSKLRVRYSLDVTQIAISPQAYEFYREVKENNESSGSFFDEQKGLIAGNIEVVGDENFPVLGYFEVGGVGEVQRVFSPQDFFEEGFDPTVPSDLCRFEIDTLLESQLILYFDSFPRNNLVFLDGAPPDRTAVAGSSRCTDCTNFGELTKPDFWP